MTDVFISYARATEVQARNAAAALRAQGFAVWRDDEIPAHLPYADVIEERLRAARAVLVIWSGEAAQSQWVRAEANVAREAGTLVQLRVDQTPLPLPFSEIQCADCSGWDGSDSHAGWQRVVGSIAALVAARPASAERAVPSRAEPQRPDRLVAVLPFDNLSGDADTGYFSDGVSEEILHTISRSKGLRVIGKASSFQFRGADKQTRRVVSELGATHLLDGSVRRAGDRIRITAQLVDTASQETLWSERYDRALTDIFALQDEIAAAIAQSLDAHFKPGQTRGAVDPAAYDLYLQARAIYDQDSTSEDRARSVSLLERAVALAPEFGMAWGQLAMFRALMLPKTSDAAGAMIRPTVKVEAERALSLDPECGPAHMALALLVPSFGGYAERIRLARRGYDLAPSENAVGHLYAGCLLAVGRNREACQIFDEIVAREPGSPYSQGVRAFFHFAAGATGRALQLAEEAVAAFPESAYPVYMREQIRRGSSYLETHTAPAAAGDALQRLEARIAATAPVLHFTHVGRAAQIGATDEAFALLLGAIGEGRPLSIDPAPQGRGFSRTLASTGLFAPVCAVLRADVRFAEVAVRLGLFDYWMERGIWPDFAGEVRYDLKAACREADLRGLPRYKEGDAR
jgi:TolB-like protein